MPFILQDEGPREARWRVLVSVQSQPLDAVLFEAGRDSAPCTTTSVSVVLGDSENAGVSRTAITVTTRRRRGDEVWPQHANVP